MHKHLNKFETSPDTGLGKLTIITDTLVCYKGGGYDGCFWEWNFAFFDKQGKFHDLFSSGSGGCTAENELTDYLNGDEERELIEIKNIQKFINDYATIQVLSVIKRLNTDLGYSIPITCYECGQQETDMDYMNTEIKGTTFLCHSCFYKDEDDEDID